MQTTWSQRASEARFQWRRALQFGPEADEIKPIEAKLDLRLDVGERADIEDRERAGSLEIGAADHAAADDRDAAHTLPRE
mgnify:CR=1 FL=1